jgi:hypothetical protein
MNNKILLISYHYPPSMAVGGLRLANFAKYLPDHGWQPYVLTIRDRYLSQMDPQRLAGLSHAPVFKTSMLPTASDLYLIAKSWIANRSGEYSDHAACCESSSDARNGDQPGGESFKHRLKRYCFSLLLHLPDLERNWVVPAVLKGRRIIKQEQIDCILTSCPPYSVHLIGLALKWLTGVRWIADFRDPWITGSNKRVYYTSRLSLAIERMLEDHVLSQADAVLGNTAVLTDLFRRTHADIDARKFTQLPNGFDPAAYSKYHGVEKFRRFTIAYTGSLYFGRNPESLFRSVRGLIDSGTMRPDQLCVRLVGHCNELDGCPTRALVKKYGLSAVVEQSPPVPRRQALEIVARSHVALLLAPNQPLQIPAKAYEYIGIGTPVLALAGEGATADMIRFTRSGEVFSPDDVQGISGFLVRAFSQSVQTGQPPSGQNLRGLDIRHIVEELARRIDTVCRFDAAEISKLTLSGV